MLPKLLVFGPISIPLLGLSFAAGALVGTFLIWRETRSRGLSEEKVFDILFLTIFFSIILGRLVYVLFHQDVFLLDWSRVFLYTRYPGISFEGALVGGVLISTLSAISHGLPVLLVFDLLAFGLSAASIFGWAGCAATSYLFDLGPKIFLFPGVFLFLTLMQTRLIKELSGVGPLSIFARRFGLLASCYLIFLSASSLILLSGKNAFYPFYQVLFPISATFFLIRYREIFKMVKFPANVLNQLNGYLENRKSDIEHRLRELKKEDPFEDKSRLLDRASDDTEAQSKAGHERVEALRRQMNMALIETRKALTKIKIGKYGVCESCGKMIDTDRLAAMPTATLCLSCEKKREK